MERKAFTRYAGSADGKASVFASGSNLFANAVNEVVVDSKVVGPKWS